MGQRSNKAIFLDRDGTINIDKHYLFRSEEFEFIPGVIEALKKLCDMDFILIIVTNQSGIARGYYTEDDLKRLNVWLQTTLKEKGIEINKILYCPHLPDAKIEKYRRTCSCRKPGVSLFLQAEKEFNIDMSQSYAIGDRMRDLSICWKSKCNGILVGESESGQDYEFSLEHSSDNVTRCQSMLEAVEYIKNREEEEK